MPWGALTQPARLVLISDRRERARSTTRSQVGSTWKSPWRPPWRPPEPPPHVRRVLGDPRCLRAGAVGRHAQGRPLGSQPRASSRGPGGQGPRPLRERRAREVGQPVLTGPLTGGGAFSFSFVPAGRHHAGSKPMMTDDRVLGEHASTRVYRIEMSFVRRHPSSIPAHRSARHLGKLRRHRSGRVGALPNRRRRPPAPCRHMADTDQTLR